MANGTAFTGKLKKEDYLARNNEVFGISFYQEFPMHLTFLPEFLDFLVELFTDKGKVCRYARGPTRQELIPVSVA